MNVQDLARNMPTQPISNESLSSNKMSITLIDYTNIMFQYDEKIKRN